MSTDHHDDHAHHEPTTFWSKYVFSTDHKVIGMQFLFASLLFVILGGLFALGVRYQIAWPGQNVPYRAILPGKMTNPAPESNLGHWQEGAKVGLPGNAVFKPGDSGTEEISDIIRPLYGDPGDVPTDTFLEGESVESRVRKTAQAMLEKMTANLAMDDATADPDQVEAVKAAVFIPSAAEGKLVRFTGDLAITVPAGTRVRSSGAVETLDDDTAGTIARQIVMGSYDPSRQEVIVTPGSTIALEDGERVELVGRMSYRPPATEGGSKIENPLDEAVNMPVRRADTRVDVRFFEQTVPVEYEFTYNLYRAGGDQTRQDWEAAREAAQVSAVPDVLDQLKAFGVGMPGGMTTDEAMTIVEELVVAIPNDNLPILEDAQAIRDDFAAKADTVRGTDPEEADRLVALGEVQAERVLKATAAPVVEVEVPAVTLTGVSAGKVNVIKDTLTDDAYLQLFTMHASIMIFFVIIPALTGAFGNFLIPLMIGARDMAFPKLNMLAFWLAAPSGVIMILSFWTELGPAGGGWTMYPTLSTLRFAPQIGTTLWIVSVGLVGFSSVVGAFNYITTIINMRAPGMTMFRMPLTVWSLFITSILALFGTPVLTAAMVMLTMDRLLGTTFFIPETGGQPLLFQHLFWFYSHPAVYIMILPAMGIVSDVLATFSRKPIFGYKPMVFAMGAIAGLGYIVWGHHMFQSGMNPVLGTTFMASTIMIAVPSAIKTFNWLGTIWGGNVRFTPPMLNALAFVSMFVIGGLSGIFMAAAPVDIHIHDTYFIVAHIHYVLFGGSIFGIFAGVYYWFPKMFGRQLNQKWGVIHWVMNMVSFNGTFFLMHVLGVGGHPRRYASIMQYPTLEHLQPMNVVMTLFALSLGAAQLPFFFNVFTSLPRKAGRALVATFIVALAAPTIAGLSFWAASNGEAALTLFGVPVFDAMLVGEGHTGYNGTATLLGYLFSIAGLIALLVSMVRGLPLGGKIATLILGIPLTIYLIAVAMASSAGSLLYPMTSSDDTPLMELGHLLHLVVWSPLSAHVLIAIGHAVIAGLIIVGLVFGIWFVGGKIQMPRFLGWAMYAVFLPLWLSPFIIKPDMWVMLGMPQLGSLAPYFIGLLILPGLAYVIVKRPKDEFGYEVDTNPWEANSLEWVATQSPPVFLNFDEIPTVYRGAYEFSSPAVEEDYLPQVKELPKGVVEPSGH